MSAWRKKFFGQRRETDDALTTVVFFGPERKSKESHA